MKVQDILKEIEYSEDPENASASLVVAVSNIPNYNHIDRFYPNSNSIRE